MINLLTIIGARPQIIKAAFSRAVASHNASRPETPVREWILHTGQHYDENMSGVFFSELGIPHPDYNLGVGSSNHGEQTARMIEGVEKVLTGKLADRSGGCHADWDGVVLYGDTNSTLAGATVHRQENTDDTDRLGSIFAALSKIAESTKVVIPLHPRTAKVLSTIISYTRK